MNRLVVTLLCLLSALGLQARQARKPQKPIWVIDAGHGGHDWGCGKKPMMEKVITLAVAKEVGRLLGQQIPEVQVVYTRESDVYPTLAARAEKANRQGAELFISIHVNEAPSSDARGTETFIATCAATKGINANKSEMLALLMQKHYLSRGRGISRGVKKRELFVIEQTRMPSVLTEIGFLSNSADSAAMCSTEGQAVFAQAIVDALVEYRQKTLGGVKSRDLLNLRYAYQDYRVEEEKPVGITQKPAVQAQPSQAQNITSAKTQDTTYVQANGTPTTPEFEPVDDKPYFAIQLLNSSKQIAPDDSRLGGVTPTKCIKIGNLYKVIARISPTYEDARAKLAEIRTIFPDAFVVAFVGDEQITVAEAREMLK